MENFSLKRIIIEKLSYEFRIFFMPDIEKKTFESFHVHSEKEWYY